MMTKTSPAHRSKGSVAIELASVIVLLALLLAAVLVLGRMIWHHSVAKNVASNTAHYIARGTWAEIKSGARAASAQAMAIQAVADAGIHGGASIFIACMPTGFCTSSTPPTSILVGVQVTWDDDDSWFGNGWTVEAGTTVPYAN